MSEEIEALSEAIAINRERVLEELLDALGINEMKESDFAELLEIMMKKDLEWFKLKKALDSQVIVEDVLKNRLI